jgi:hypothetical protein
VKRALLFVLLLGGCDFFNEKPDPLQDLGKAQVELSKTFKVQVAIIFKPDDLKTARHAKVKLQKKPAEFTRQEIDRNVNIVLHRFIPRVETIDIDVPDT